MSRNKLVRSKNLLSYKWRPVECLLGLCVLTPYVEAYGCKSVSVMLLANPDSGKTYEIQKWYDTPNTMVYTDLTYHELLSTALPQSYLDKTKTIFLPDFVKLVMKNRSTANNVISLISALIEEGISKVPGYDHRDYRQMRLNIIFALTRNVFIEDCAYPFAKIGFFSRCIPFSYSYSNKRRDVLNMLAGTEWIPPQKQIDLSEIIKRGIEWQESEIIIKISPKYNHDLNIISNQIGHYNPPGNEILENADGARHKKQLMSLARASALYNNRTKVNNEDIQTIKYLLQWMNYDFKEL